MGRFSAFILKTGIRVLVLVPVEFYNINAPFDVSFLRTPGDIGVYKHLVGLCKDPFCFETVSIEREA